VKRNESRWSPQQPKGMFIERYCLISFYPLEFEQNVRNIAKRYIQDIQPGEKTKRGYSL
jgi:hypothetical protein